MCSSHTPTGLHLTGIIHPLVTTLQWSSHRQFVLFPSSSRCPEPGDWGRAPADRTRSQSGSSVPPGSDENHQYQPVAVGSVLDEGSACSAEIHPVWVNAGLSKRGSEKMSCWSPRNSMWCITSLPRPKWINTAVENGKNQASLFFLLVHNRRGNLPSWPHAGRSVDPFWNYTELGT